jgi:hypothetical protein
LGDVPNIYNTYGRGNNCKVRAMWYGVLWCPIYILPMFTSVKHLVVACAIRVLAKVRTALLCQLPQRLLMCLFVQHAWKWRQLLFCSHNGDISCLRMNILR